MGLAPYGKPEIDLSFFCKPTNEGYHTDHNYFRTRKSASQYEQFYSEKLIEKLGPPCHKGTKINEYYKNVAASTQATLEKSALSLIKKLYSLTKKSNLCLAGGVALNCSLNKIIAKLPFIDKFFVQPAASDRGLALGCALYACSQHNI